MARKPGSVEAVIDGRALSFKGSFDQDLTTSTVSAEVAMDGDVILLETPKIAKVTGTIQLPPGVTVKEIAAIRDQTLRLVVGHLKTTWPKAAVNVTGGMNEKLELPIEIFPLSTPIEEAE